MRELMRSVCRGAFPRIGANFAAVHADIAQDAFVELGDTQHVFTIAKVSPDGVEEDANQHKQFSRWSMHTFCVLIADWCVFSRIDRVNAAIGGGKIGSFPVLLRKATAMAGQSRAGETGK